MENHKIFNLFKFEQVIQTLFAIGVFEKKICFKIIFYRKTKKFDLLFTRMPLISNFSTYGSFQQLMSNKNDAVEDILIFHQTNKGIVTYFSGGFFYTACMILPTEENSTLGIYLLKIHHKFTNIASVIVFLVTFRTNDPFK